MITYDITLKMEDYGSTLRQSCAIVPDIWNIINYYVRDYHCYKWKEKMKELNKEYLKYFWPNSNNQVWYASEFSLIINNGMVINYRYLSDRFIRNFKHNIGIKSSTSYNTGYSLPKNY